MRAEPKHENGFKMACLDSALRFLKQVRWHRHKIKGLTYHKRTLFRKTLQNEISINKLKYYVCQTV